MILIKLSEGDIILNKNSIQALSAENIDEDTVKIQISIPGDSIEFNLGKYKYEELIKQLMPVKI